MTKQLQDKIASLATEMFNSSENPLLEAKASEQRKEVMLDDTQETQNGVEETTPVESSATEIVQPESTVETVAKQPPAEEMVPKANVDGEVRRRLAEELPNLVQQAVNQALANRPIQTQPQVSVASEEAKYKGYTKAQL